MEDSKGQRGGLPESKDAPKMFSLSIDNEKRSHTRNPTVYNESEFIMYADTKAAKTQLV